MNNHARGDAASYTQPTSQPTLTVRLISGNNNNNNNNIISVNAGSYCHINFGLKVPPESNLITLSL
jgi:hypothetical protein